MVEIIISVAAKVAEYLVAPIGRQFSYLCNHESHFKELKDKVDKLKDAKIRVQRKVDDAKRKVEKIEENVEKWQDSVDKIIDEAGQFLEAEEKAQDRCFKGLYLNLTTRYKHSREALKKVKVVAELLQEGGTFNEVSYPTVPEDIWLASNKGYEAFESRKSTLKDVLSTLHNANVDMVGVYGMGGIGKTTLVKEVGRQAKNDKLFDEVVFVEVSENPDIKNIQQEIAGTLRLDLCGETTESQRANKLYARLKNEKRILIILDNIWKYDLDLKEVGIPFGDDHRGCKLLLTSRVRDVLERMGCKPFRIVDLSEQESWSLFKKMAGDCIENRELRPIAIQVVKECGGLPIAIVTVGNALKNRSTSEWQDALRELRRPSPANFEGVLEEAYSKIKLSFDYLKREELKKTFLLCSLMEHPLSMLDLFKYVMGLDILEGDIPDMEQARNRLEKVVRELKDSCLLVDNNISEWFSRPGEHFSMHDVVRDVAVSIALKDQHVFTKRNEDLRKWPDEEKLKKCTKISLLNSNICEFPQGLECPELGFLCMSSNDSSFEIPDNFFKGMTKLKVLSIIGKQMLSLPISLHLPVNIQTLCLHYSKFEDVAIIGELKGLKILSLRCSEIKQLPKEIGQLTQLRLLDLSHCEELKVIAQNVISSLSQLEELYMRNCFVEWEVEGLNIGRGNASLDELKNLSHLTTLEIVIKDDKIFPKGLLSKKLERYKISIGDDWNWWKKLETSRVLKLKCNSKICRNELQGVKNVEELYLDELKDVKNVLYELDEEGFSQLKHLHITESSDLLCIVDSMNSVCHDPFPLLESLTLSYLSNLKKICHGPSTIVSFLHLKLITVSECVKLKNVFSFSNVKSLPLLQTITMDSCQNIKEIFSVEMEDNADINEVIEKIEFGQLRSLRLKNLPQLTTFYSKVKTSSISQNMLELTIESQSNDILLEDEFHNPVSLFQEKVVFPNLEELELMHIDIEKIWSSQPQIMSSCYQRTLKSLVLFRCENLKYVFPSSIVRSFEQLQHLQICCCSILKEIVAKGEEAAPTFVFPRVTTLELTRLPELTTFYPGTHTSEWPMLKELKVYGCDKVNVFTSKVLNFHENNRRSELDVPVRQSLFMEEKINPDLKELTLRGKDIVMMWQDQCPENLFNRLQVLKIEDDESINIPLGFLLRFKGLVKLELQLSSNKEIFACGEGTDNHDGMLAHDLNLENLSIQCCYRLINLGPSLASFQSLTVLEVQQCDGLINLITPLTVKSLVQLREMKIEDCKMMTEIVENLGDQARDEIVFSKLKSLSLVDLESLTCFCYGNYTFKFPSLEELIVDRCPNMKTFSGGVLSTPRLQKVKKHWYRDEWCWESDLNTTIQLLYKKALNSKSEELTVCGKDVTKIWQGQFPEHHFSGVKVLNVIKDESESIPIAVLQRFDNLEKLILKVSSYKEIFSCGEGKSHVIGTLIQIKVLKLRGLFNMKCMWKEDSQLDSILQNLEILQLHYCHNLINLVPSSASFENLTTLEVCFCDGLINLITSSTTKSLARLERMDIAYCAMMKEVVANEGEVMEDEIVFDKLSSLSLDRLENLTSFCSGNRTFKFPSLKNIDVWNCPKMKTFSGGALSTPCLERVRRDGVTLKGVGMLTLLQSYNTQPEKNVQSSENNSGQPSIQPPK